MTIVLVSATVKATAPPAYPTEWGGPERPFRRAGPSTGQFLSLLPTVSL